MADRVSLLSLTDGLSPIVIVEQGSYGLLLTAHTSVWMFFVLLLTERWLQWFLLSTGNEEYEKINSKCYLRLRTFSILVDRNEMENSTIFTHIKGLGCSQSVLTVEFNGWRSALNSWRDGCFLDWFPNLIHVSSVQSKQFFFFFVLICSCYFVVLTAVSLCVVWFYVHL